MTTDTLTGEPKATLLEPTLVRAAELLARADTSLARVLHDPELRKVTVGELADLAKAASNRSRRVHLLPLPSPPPSDAPRSLSERELQVVRLLAEGISNKQIGLRLKLSDKTVKNHISHILGKLKLRARTQVAVWALRTGVI